jgi:uncharacterized protein (TIGR03083 family)
MTKQPEPLSDAELRELLAAYALHATLPGEAPQLERYLARNPDADAEIARLSTAAAWIGATEALTPPPALRQSVLSAARARPRGAGTGTGELLGLYGTMTGRFDELLDTLAPGDLEASTANGLSARDLVIHLAAMETMVAEGLGVPVGAPDGGTNVDSRTAAFVDRFDGVPVDEVRALWRDAVAGVTGWATTGADTGLVPWLGIDVSRDSLLISRAFETWIHSDDIRRAIGRPLEPPPPSHLHRMADFSMRNLPAWLAVAGCAHPGRTARFVLTGEGGGSWLVPLAPEATAVEDAVDVILEVDVVDWCHRVGERVSPEVIPVRVAGDAALAADILDAASVLATL